MLLKLVPARIRRRQCTGSPHRTEDGRLLGKDEVGQRMEWSMELMKMLMKLVLRWVQKKAMHWFPAWN